MKRNWKIAAVAAAAVLPALALCGCATMDETFLDTEANYNVDINVPYATATPLPEYLNVPDAIVIDADGNVTLNDASIIEGDFQSVLRQEEQTEYRSLSLGSNGIAVQALQSRLKELGYYEGEISGLYDPATEDAVKQFEKTYGTMQTGVATAKLQLRLFSASAPAYGSPEYNEAVVSQYSVLRPGTVGSSVYALQQRLKNLGYPITDLTGAYDEQTAFCVRLFYQSYGIAASDVADVNMQRQLYSEDAKAYDPSLAPIATTPPDVTAPPEADDTATEGEPPEDSGGEAIVMGNSGVRVTVIQQRLIALGYLQRGADSGVFDESTQDAVNRFLQAIGRAPTGELTQDMQDFLLSDSAPAFGGESGAAQTEYQNLKPGDSGEAVLKLQRRLVELGYANGTPNGQYGNATVSAVRLFQQVNGMDADGIASSWMQSQLFAADAKTYQEAMGVNPSNPFPELVGTPTPAPTPEGDTLYFTLSVGSTGSAVEDLQARLVELGYPTSVSKTYDETTRQAVIAFQVAIGVTPNGEASPSLQRYIYSKAAPGPSVRFYKNPPAFTALGPGDSSDGVTNLQRQLFSLNFLKWDDVQGSVGTYNESTRMAVARAQEAMGYRSADGNAGVEFQAFLFSKYSKKIKQ